MQTTVNVAQHDSEREGSQGYLNHRMARLFKPFGGRMPKLLPALLICLLVAMGRGTSNAQVATPISVGAQSDAQKAFEKLKSLTGSWQGSVGRLPTQATIRVTSGGSAIMHDAFMASTNKITMIYLEGDRLFLTHYADENRERMEGKLLPDGNRVEFNSLDVGGSTQRGFMKRLMFIMIAADRHGVEATYILPDGKPVEARGEFQRTTATHSLHSGNKRLYDGGAMMLLLSAEKTPEEYYSFKPTDADPSFGQMLAVVANAQYENCSAVLGEKNSRPKIDSTRTPKADLISALKDAFAYCGKAYDGMTDASAAQLVTFSGPMGPVPIPKQNLLNINMGLNALHYGNLMVYMRLKNIVPPSADPEVQKQAGKILKK
jgi:uncharacterized damage-inducible protein DinB